MRIATLILVCMELVALWAEGAHACSCVNSTRYCGKVGPGPIFIGEVVERKGLKEVWPGTKDSFILRYELRVRVIEPIRNISQQYLSVETGMGGGDCGIPLAVGTQAIFFPSRRDDGKYEIGLCDGTAELEKVDPGLLEYLRQTAETKTGSIVGAVYKLILAPDGSNVPKEFESHEDIAGLKGVKILISAAGTLQAVSTDERGNYAAEGLAPGSYKVSVQMPDGYHNSDDDHAELVPNTSVAVYAGGCTEEYFVAVSNAAISGTVVGASGSPFRNATVELVLLTSGRIGKRTWSDSQGRFAFEAIPPGNYGLRIGVNDRVSEVHVPPTHVIQLGAGEKVDNIRFVVGGR